MKPGKLFSLYNNSVTMYPNTRISHCPNFGEEGIELAPNTIFMVLSVKPDAKIFNFYDLHIPWLILVGNRIGLIDIMNISLLDVTPL